MKLWVYFTKGDPTFEKLYAKESGAISYIQGGAQLKTLLSLSFKNRLRDISRKNSIKGNPKSFTDMGGPAGYGGNVNFLPNENFETARQDRDPAGNPREQAITNEMRKGIQDSLAILQKNMERPAAGNKPGRGRPSVHFPTNLPQDAFWTIFRLHTEGELETKDIVNLLNSPTTVHFQVGTNDNIDISSLKPQAFAGNKQWSKWTEAAIHSILVRCSLFANKLKGDYKVKGEVPIPEAFKSLSRRMVEVGLEKTSSIKEIDSKNRNMVLLTRLQKI